MTEYYCTDFSQKAASGKGKMFRKLDAMRRPIGQGSERERRDYSDFEISAHAHMVMEWFCMLCVEMFCFLSISEAVYLFGLRQCQL